MAEIVYMPKLSDTMTEGVVAAWTKNVGDAVKTGEILAEIETDKATMEFESFYDGVLLYIGVETGKTAPVNAILAIIGDKGEDIASLITATPEVTVISEKKVEEKKEATPTPLVVKEKAPVAEVKSIPLSSNSGRIFASPLAKKLAEEKGIDINAVSGTGENGRIIKKDVDHYTPYTPANRIFSQAPLGVEGFTDEPVSQMRKTISRRLAESKFSAPHFYLTLDIDMDQAITIRKGLNSVEGVKVSFNDMVVKAVGMSLKQHPIVNSAWMGDFIRKNQHVHVGVAVAVEDGLLVPVIRFADSKGILEIASEVREYAEKAKDKKLQPSDWEGNTFTISNLGMFGIESFTAIINAPDSCIMAVGGIKEVPVVKDGKIVPGNVMKVTLSCDHRVVDGASGASFLQTFKQYMENPVSMLI
ncbi:MAG: pyruvate dehydrogenase complex dihydrolipoamide acetyltransferase [Flavobacteriia bacterium]|nr:pyruvate dehydrogenase complex dihydrolipoamide acetyltransferase [Flavobacteriia bacterium]